MTRSPLALGIDIGGTFTDIVVHDQGDGRVLSHKELTTPHDPTEGAIRGIVTLLEREQLSPDRITRVVHATTLFTNALIERKGARTGLITTKGFRDTLELRREHKYELYDLFIEVPEALIPRHLRLEVAERVGPRGEVAMALDEHGLLSAARELVGKGIETVAIVFLHAYANPAHERRARDVLEQHFPGLLVSISSEVSPQIREYERTSTTVANAYVRPMANRYLRTLETRLMNIGVGCPLLMMLSNGGFTHAEEACRFPVQLLESGPAAGAIAAAYFSKQSGIADVLAFDMGGTTAKLSIVQNNQPSIAFQFEAGRERRFVQGSGMPINISTVELLEVGAGGGSIAHLDVLGLLKVGPRSAGSHPGPACYASGGTQPTVTDANLFVGHLDPETFAGGTMKLDRDAGARAIGQITAPLRLGPEQVTGGMLAVVNENMASAARVHIAEGGHDVGRFALLVTGGGGPLHGCDVARRLGIRRVICPPSAGVASAVGLLVAPARIDRVRSLARELQALTASELEALFAALEQDAATVMTTTLGAGARYRFERTADMRFVGQGFEIVTPLPVGPFEEETLLRVKSAFVDLYRRVFTHVPPVDDVEIVNLRLAAIENAVERTIALDSTSRQPWRIGTGHRDVWHEATGTWQRLQVLAREALSPGQELFGPIVIEDASSTLVLPDGARAIRDTFGNLVVDLEAASDSTWSKRATGVRPQDQHHRS